MKHFAGFLFFLICALLLACGGKADHAVFSGASMARMAYTENSDQIAFESADEKQAAPMTLSSPGQAGALENAAQTRKLVKRANLRLRVEDPSVTEKPLTDIMGKYGAWPASTGVYENSRDYSIRVPSRASAYFS